MREPLIPPTNVWDIWTGWTQEVVFRLRFSIAFLVMMIMVFAGLIVIHLAAGSWKRVDRRLKERMRGHSGDGESRPTPNIWEAAGERAKGTDVVGGAGGRSEGDDDEPPAPESPGPRG